MPVLFGNCMLRRRGHCSPDQRHMFSVGFPPGDTDTWGLLLEQPRRCARCGDRHGHLYGRAIAERQHRCMWILNVRRLTTRAIVMRPENGICETCRGAYELGQ